ncbi:MAG: AI-2E family transporter [Ignavibacteria bacterium]|nr:AI-2E family transporter [Ignavibacteria bacterium]
MKHLNLLVVFLGIVAVFVIGVILQELRSVLLPFVLAILFSVAFKPLVLSLNARRIPMAVSLFVVMLSVAALLFLLALLLYSSAESFVAAAPRYEARLTSLTNNMVVTLNELARRFDVHVDEIRSSDLVRLSSLSAGIVSGLGTLFNMLGNVFLIVLFMLFMLGGSGDLSAKVEKAFPAEQAERIGAIVKNISQQVRQYLVTKTLISVGTGTLAALVLWLLGVDFPLLWGFLAIVLNFIPNIGSVVATILPFLLSLLQFDGIGRPILVLALLSLVQVGMGNVIEPKIMGFSLNMSALVILLSLIFWGWLWGIWGMVLAVPLTATIKIILENIEPLRPLSILMSGRTNAGG